MSQNLVVLKEKKTYYVANLTKGISNMFLEAFISIYKAVKEKNKRKKFLMKEYQDAMKDISQWPSDTIHKEYKRFKNQYKNLDNIVTGIMLILYSINDIKHKNFPKVEDYLYQVYLNIARQLWKEPFLVYDVNIDRVTYQKHILTIQKIISDNIAKTFNDMIPEQDMCGDICADNARSDKGAEESEGIDEEEGDTGIDEEEGEGIDEEEGAEKSEGIDEEEGEGIDESDGTEDSESEAEVGENVSEEEEGVFLLDEEDSVQGGPCSQSSDEDLIVVKRNIAETEEENESSDTEADHIIEAPHVRVVNITDPPDIKKLRTKDSFF